MARTPTNILRVEGDGWRLAHERRLQDVAALSVGQEATLVQVHLLTWGLEVQSHCGREERSQ